MRVRLAIVGAALLATSALGLGGCQAVVDRRGFLPDDGQSLDFRAGVDTKTSVLTRLGNPSQIGVFDEQVWYYVSATQSQVAFRMPRTTERTITAISFNDDDQVSAVKRYTLADGRVVNYDDRRTPTRGREVTFLEQIFGSIGRAPVTLPGQDPNLPTSSGGPRRN